MFEPTQSQFEQAKEARISEKASELLNGNLFNLFLDMEDAEQYVKELYSAGPLGLINLQERFRLRMAHEAIAHAERKMSATDQALLFNALTEGNAFDVLEMRRA